jgi:hypothetical protein
MTLTEMYLAVLEADSLLGAQAVVEAYVEQEREKAKLRKRFSRASHRDRHSDPPRVHY